MGLTESDGVTMATALQSEFCRPIPPPPSRSPPRLVEDAAERISPEGQERYAPVAPPSGEAGSEALERFSVMAKKFANEGGAAGAGQGFRFTPEMLTLFPGAGQEALALGGERSAFKPTKVLATEEDHVPPAFCTHDHHAHAYSPQQSPPPPLSYLDSNFPLPPQHQPSHSTGPPIDIDTHTESNHDTALTLASAGGYDDLVELLLRKGANLEHKDKKGYTPLILAATAGHAATVEILLQHGATIEAQSDRTKDTALSLACSGGRLEVVDILLAHKADFEHRNVSDYTPLSLAASGGFVNTIKTLLAHGAEINSRTGSKLGISPLMLAAMNGHTAAVKLLLDRGSDINAQIETNRNTALTLACFQGRHEVVQLLIDRRANIEHRAKTGLTPLMEAASGGYVEVGRILLASGADVNASPVPSSKDTALTIAADKGHGKFVELLLGKKAHVDVRNKKGASPLWLACAGGHWEVVQGLVKAGADADVEDNRKVSCLMAAFRKGHVKVVKYMVKCVNQFPNDADLTRFISTMTDKEILKKANLCRDIIISARDRQAAEANRHATSLLRELDMERTKEENRKAAAARRRDKRKRQKQRRTQEKEERERAKMTQRTAPDGSESETTTAPVASPVAGSKTEEKSESEAQPVTSRPGKKQNKESKSSRRGRRLSGNSSGSSEAAPLMSSSPPPPHESSPRGKMGRRSEEGWKEVVRKSKRMVISSSVVNRIIGRGGMTLTAVREATGAHIDLDRAKSAQERVVTIKGSTDAVRIASNALSSLIKEPDREVYDFLPKQTDFQPATLPSPTAAFPPNLPPRQQAKLSTSLAKTQPKPPAARAPPTASTITVTSTTKPKLQTTTIKSAKTPLQPKPIASQTPAKRQLFSAAAAPTQPRPPQARATATQPRSPRSAWNQKHETAHPNAWNVPAQKTKKPAETKSVTMATTVTSSVASSFTPLSHFEPLIPASSASSSKAPSPLPSPSASAAESPSSAQSKSPGPPKSVAPIGGERAQESPSPSAAPPSLPPLEEKLPVVTERLPPAPPTPPAYVVTTMTAAPQPPQPPLLARAGVIGSGGNIKPIGTERRTAKRRSEPVPTAIVTPDPAGGRQSHTFNPPPETWGIPTFRPDSWPLSGVPVSSQMAAAAAAAAAATSTLQPAPPRSPPPPSHPPPGRLQYYGGLNSLATLLDKLSLTKHLDLFQQNEIDLDALMLMSEKDYAEIGLPKGPRIKLLNATRRRVDDAGEPFTSPLTSPSPVTSASFVPYASPVSAPQTSNRSAGPSAAQRWDGARGGAQATTTTTASAQRQQGPAPNRNAPNASKGDWKGWNQPV